MLEPVLVLVPGPGLVPEPPLPQPPQAARRGQVLASPSVWRAIRSVDTAHLGRPCRHQPHIRLCLVQSTTERPQLALELMGPHSRLQELVLVQRQLALHQTPVVAARGRGQRCRVSVTVV